MSENNPTSLIDQIRCGHCEGYLSCTPICVLPNGNFTCGRCAPLNDGTLVYRALTLENALSNVSFPCRFKQYGCTENVLFDKSAEHNDKCCYRTFVCPTLPEVDCKWEGPTSQMFDHFTDHHPDFVMQNAEFELQVNQDLQCMLLTMKNDVVFFIKYEYDASEKHFKYDIRHCLNKIVNDVSYKVQLMSMSDNDCSTKLKTNKCPILINNLLDEQSAVVINLNSFLEIAEYPVNIKIVFNLTVVESTNISDDRAVDYSLLESIRCPECNKYLIPPLFNRDDETICSVCAKGNSSCTPSSNTKIKNLVAVANYPCRWRECNFVGKSGDIIMHESICKFRYHHCFYKDCRHSFKFVDAVRHIKTHDQYATYLQDKIIYKISFDINYTWKHVLTTKDDDIFSIFHSIVTAKDNSFNTHVVLFRTSVFKTNSASLYFEHNHCKLRSKIFTLKKGDDSRHIAIKDLPQCFESNQELTIYVEINEPQG